MNLEGRFTFGFLQPTKIDIFFYFIFFYQKRQDDFSLWFVLTVYFSSEGKEKKSIHAKKKKKPGVNTMLLTGKALRRTLSFRVLATLQNHKKNI